MTHQQPIIEVNLSALAENFRALCARHARGNCAAVVKANAYGLGVVSVAAKLAAEGCKTFFVASLEEGVALRKVLPVETIYVFHGVASGEADVFIAEKLFPVLNSLEQIALWRAALARGEVDSEIGAALQVDTGMNRLGLSYAQVKNLALQPELLRACRVRLLMSHLACANEEDVLFSELQRQIFDEIRQLLPALECSLANSAGLYLAENFHYDLGRPGCSLYGIAPNNQHKMQPVATLKAPILQIRNIETDGTIGYGAEQKVYRGMKTATVAMGYADGLLRVSRGKMCGFIEGISLPMLGRVSMDMTCFDVTKVPDEILVRNQYIELINQVQTVDAVAEICATIGYEIFTRLGSRVQRIYK